MWPDSRREIERPWVRNFVIGVAINFRRRAKYTQWGTIISPPTTTHMAKWNDSMIQACLYYHSREMSGLSCEQAYTCTRQLWRSRMTKKKQLNFIFFLFSKSFKLSKRMRLVINRTQENVLKNHCSTMLLYCMSIAMI